MKLNSRNSIIFVLVFAFIIYIIFRVYYFMMSPAPSDYNYLKIGDKAPDFLCKCNNSEKKDTFLKLSDHIRKNDWVVVYFYPKDNTKYCTRQALSFVAKYNELKDLKCEIIGISSDGEESHKKFIEKYKIPYPLVCDTSYQIHDKYGACSKIPIWGRKTYRMTFVVDNTGVIRSIIKDIDTLHHATQVLDIIKGFNRH